MAGGSLRYAGARAAGMLGIPQSRIEKGKLAGERQTALDNMVKALEDNYDGKAMVGGQETGLTRDIFRTYAYDKSDSNHFYDDLSTETKAAVDQTNIAYDTYRDAQGAYDRMRTTGKKADGSDVTDADLSAAWAKVETSRTAYQTLKASTDKKVDTDFNAKMLREVKDDPKKIKEKGRRAVKQAIATYDHVADGDFSSDSIAKGKQVVVGHDEDGKPKKGTASTKTASDHYTMQQDRTTHSRSATQWTNANHRGGGGSGGSSS